MSTANRACKTKQNKDQLVSQATPPILCGSFTYKLYQCQDPVLGPIRIKVLILWHYVITLRLCLHCSQLAV